MKVQTKSILILLVTLIIGIVLGAVGSGMLREYVIRSRMSELRSPQRFSRMMERVIKPTAEQQEKLRDKFEQQHERVFALSEKFRTQMDSLNTTFENELKDVLTPEQMDRLSEFLKDRPRPPRPGRGEGRFREHRPRPR